MSSEDLTRDPASLLPSGHARELEAQLVAWRRGFHAYPELAFGEFRTASIVAEYLASLGYAVRLGQDVMDESAIHYKDVDEIERSFASARAAGVDAVFLGRMEGGLTAVVADLQTGSGPTVAFRI